MGFFSDIERELKNFGGGLAEIGKDILGGLNSAYNDIAEAIAKPLGVHPDVVKVAAAALGMYHTAGGGFVDAAGQTVSEAAAADLVSAYGADALAASNQMAAAAELAAATGTTLPYAVDPAQLVSTLAAEGQIAAAAQVATTANVSTAPIVQNLIAAGDYDAAINLTKATNPSNLGFVNRDIGLAKTAAAFPVATSPLASPSMLAGDTLGASLSGLTSEQIAAATSANALAPGAAVTGAGATNALAPVFDPASAMETQLAATPAAATPAATNALAGYGGAGDVLNPATGAVTTGADAATGLAAAGAGAGAANAATGAAGTGVVSGYGGAGDVLDPVTGSVITGADAAGLSAGAFDTLAKFAKDYGVPLASLISGITGSQAAKSAADVQAQSAREARDLAKEIYEKQVSLQEPFRTAGITAQNQLMTLLGLQGGTPGAEFGRYARPFGMSDFQADPGYAFRLSEGLKALEASHAAKSGLLSGSAIKAGIRYGQQMGLQEYGNAFNRFQTERTNRLAPLGSLMQTGQAAASGMAGNAGTYGATAGGLTTDIGATQAAGQLGSAKAISNALGAYMNYLGNQDLANAIAQRRQSQYSFS